MICQDGTKKYVFDHVFSAADNNEVVYRTIGEEAISATMRGINATFFAYGQTGSGKSPTASVRLNRPSFWFILSTSVHLLI
jgi:hypothetical protein